MSSRAAPKRRAGRRLASAALVLPIAAAIVLALELVVRAAGLVGTPYQRLDQTFGWRHIPGAHGRYVSAEARAPFHIDRLGLVGPERTVAKPAGVRRLLAIGDSFTESLQVPYAESWPALLERRLGPSWQVLNAGVGGYGTDNELLSLRENGLALQPDVVLLVVFTGNDVSDNDHELSVRTALTAAKPYFTLDARGRLVLHPLPARRSGTGARLAEWLKEESRLYDFLRERWWAIQSARRAAATEPGNEVPFGWQVYARHPSPKWERAWAVTGALLQAMDEECTRAGVPLVVASLPTSWRIDPGQLAATIRTYPALADTARWDFTAPDRRVAQLCRSLRIPYVPLERPLEEAARAGQPLYADHLNTRGHRVVAEYLGLSLRQLGVLRGS